MSQPMTTSASVLARTPLHHWHAAHQAQFAERDGWQVVTTYAESAREPTAMRTGLAIADISALAKFSLLGKGLADVLPTVVRDPAALQVRGVSRLATDEEVLACRLTAEHLLLLAATTDARPLASSPPSSAIVSTDVTSAYAGFCLLGAPWEEVLRRVTHLDVAAALPENACAETNLAGVPALLVRVAEFSLPSVRVYVAWDLGEDVWERLVEAGRNWGLIPVGLDCLAQLRQTTARENLL